MFNLTVRKCIRFHTDLHDDIWLKLDLVLPFPPYKGLSIAGSEGDQQTMTLKRPWIRLEQVHWSPDDHKFVGHVEVGYHLFNPPKTLENRRVEVTNGYLAEGWLIDPAFAPVETS